MNHYKISYRTILLALAVGAAQPGLAQQQQQPVSEIERPEPFLRRFSIGGRLSLLGTNLMTSGETKRSTSEPPVVITTTGGSASKRVGGGITLEFALTDRVSLGADLLYKRAGYNQTITQVTGVDDADTTAVESQTSHDIENTRADLWDVPIVGRYYNKGRHGEGARAFFLGGAAFRHASAVRTVREVVRPDGLSDTSDQAIVPAQTNIAGIVLGGGFQIGDDLRFKFTPEIRYTRWLRSTFDNLPTRSSKHQVEVIFGLTF